MEETWTDKKEREIILAELEAFNIAFGQNRDSRGREDWYLLAHGYAAGAIGVYSSLYELFIECVTGVEI